MLERCAVEGISTVMVEGGGKIAAAFLRAGLVSRIEWFRAPILLGGDGLPAIGPLNLPKISSAARWRAVATERIGDDVLESYVKVE
ncbi:MAG: dihydrofolate reductase family protein [Hyphomonadaceae bacterium]|nr:dihydrofolate reductase family protein [Hyphomonadaceae bacterium]